MRKQDAAANWKGWLDGAVRRGEFRQAERDWLGLDAWLDGRGGTTREDVEAFINANQVQDVVLGEMKPVPAPGHHRRGRSGLLSRPRLNTLFGTHPAWSKPQPQVINHPEV